MGKYLNMKKNTIILDKPSATIAAGFSENLSALQRKFYDGLLYVAKEELKKNANKTKFQISFSELKNFFVSKETGDYKNNKYIKEQIKKLMTTLAEYNIFKKDKEIKWLVFSLLPLVNVENGIVEFEIPSPVREALINEKKGIFGKIDLIIIKNLKSKYSIILYELLKDYHSVEIPVMTIEVFRKLFNISKKYKNFADVREKVLDPAVKELNSNPKIEWNVSYELYKTGPKYTHIKFTKSPKALIELQKQKAQKVKNKNYTQIVKYLMQSIPEEYRKKSLADFLLRVLPEKGLEYIQKQIEYTNKAKPKNYIAYLKQAIAEDYADMEQQARLEAIEQKKKAEEEARKKAEEERRKREQEEHERAREKFESLPKEKQLEYILKVAKKNSLVKDWVNKGIEKNWDNIRPVVVEEYKEELKKATNDLIEKMKL